MPTVTTSLKQKVTEQNIKTLVLKYKQGSFEHISPLLKLSTPQSVKLCGLAVKRADQFFFIVELEGYAIICHLVQKMSMFVMSSPCLSMLHHSKLQSFNIFSMINKQQETCTTWLGVRIINNTCQSQLKML